MSRNYRNLYGGEEAYPDLYIAAKLYTTASKVLNSYLRFIDVHEDDISTLVFYSNLASQRAAISNHEIEEVYKNRDTVYNKPYTCREHLSEADLAAFLVTKSLRMKNILSAAGGWHKDSVLDFAIYLQMLRQKLRLI